MSNTGDLFTELSASLVRDLREANEQTRTDYLQCLIQIGFTIDPGAKHLQKLTGEWATGALCDRLSGLVKNALSLRQLDILRRVLAYVGGPTGRSLPQSQPPMLDQSRRQTIEAITECLGLGTSSLNDFGYRESIGALLQQCEAFKDGSIAQEAILQRHNNLICSLGLGGSRLISLMAGSESEIHVLCIPGGGFRGFNEKGIHKDGYHPAEQLNKWGVHAHILTRYTSTQDTPSPLLDAPLADVEDAIKTIREKHPGSLLGLMCWSAGGLLGGRLIHLADFVVMAYTVTSLDDGTTHMESRSNLLGPMPSKYQISKFSVPRYVNKSTCPAYIFHSRKDEKVNFEDALQLLRAYIEAGRPVKFVAVPDGAHGAHSIDDLIGLREFVCDDIKHIHLPVTANFNISEMVITRDEQVVVVQNY